MKAKIFGLAAAVALVLSMGSTAKADSFTWTLASGLTASEDLQTSGNTFTITFTITNTTGANAGVYDFSLGVSPGGSLSGVNISGTGTSGTGFEFFGNEKQNNGSGTTCTSGVGGWVCVDYSGGFDTIAANGGTLTYTITGTFSGSLDTDPHLMAQGCVDTSQTATTGGPPPHVTYNCPYNGAGSYNISLDGTPGQVPEPGSLMLFGTGLLGMAGFVRRKFMA